MCFHSHPLQRWSNVNASSFVELSTHHANQFTYRVFCVRLHAPDRASCTVMVRHKYTNRYSSAPCCDTSITQSRSIVSTWTHGALNQVYRHHSSATATKVLPNNCSTRNETIQKHFFNHDSHTKNSFTYRLTAVSGRARKRSLWWNGGGSFILCSLHNLP